jgi:mRNA interferase MazF
LLSHQSKIKGYPFEVVLPAGLAIEGAVLTDQIRSLDWKARSAKLIAKVEGPVIEDVIQRILRLLEK